MSEDPGHQPDKNIEDTGNTHEIVAQGKLCALGNMLEAYLPKHVEFLNDPNVNRYIATRPPFDIEQQRVWLQKRKQTGDKVYAILVPSGGEKWSYIGVMSLILNDARTAAESGSLIGDTQYWQQGIAREAKFMQLRIAFEDLGLKLVTSTTIGPNVRSQRLLESTGYKLVETRANARVLAGIPYDELLYEVGPESWRIAYSQYLDNQPKP